MEVSPLKLLAVATNIAGMRVVSIADNISAEQAETLRGVWAISGGELPPAEPESLPGLRLHQLAAPRYDPMRAAIEANLDVPLHKRHCRRRPPRSPRPLACLRRTGTAAAAQRQWPGISRDEATRIATRWTARCGFTDTQASEVAAWPPL